VSQIGLEGDFGELVDGNDGSAVGCPRVAAVVLDVEKRPAMDDQGHGQESDREEGGENGVGKGGGVSEVQTQQGHARRAQEKVELQGLAGKTRDLRAESQLRRAGAFPLFLQHVQSDGGDFRKEPLSPLLAGDARAEREGARAFDGPLLLEEQSAERVQGFVSREGFWNSDHV